MEKEDGECMVVLNIYGKIEPICISEKLKLYVKNLPCEEHDNWQDYIRNQLLESMKMREIRLGRYERKDDKVIRNLYSKLVSSDINAEIEADKLCYAMATNMVCLCLDYDYEDMPMGDWQTNCFDGRFCEEDYAEKIVDFMQFVSDSGYDFPKPVPQWIYSSNYDEPNIFRIFWSGEDVENYIAALKEWGKLFDKLLQEKKDYLWFGFIVNAIHKDNEYNEYHLLKAYSLCQLFLEKDKEMELDTKLQWFINDNYSSDEKACLTEQLRKMRNKLAHGDFTAFENEAETFAKNHMDGRFCFDYTEYSRKNWVISHVCCLLDDIVKTLIGMMFFDKKQLVDLKKMKDD